MHVLRSNCIICFESLYTYFHHHITQTLEEREWFANAVESLQDEVITPEERIRLAGDMLRSQAFDNFLGTKFQSVKRYGAEGGESTMGFFSEVFRRVAQGEAE